MNLRNFLLGGVALLIAGCADVPVEPVQRAAQSPAAVSTAPRILAMGDSALAAHRLGNASIPDDVARLIGEPVVNKSVVGASMLYPLPITGAMGMSIPKQYRKGDWDWVILNGGGNDLLFGCGCHGCDRVMGRLISPDGTAGAIPALVGRLRQGGAKVVYVGYLRSPGAGSPIESCRDDGDEMEARIARLAARDPGFTFVSIADLVPYGDRSFHGIDMIHPSLKGSRAIAGRVAKAILAEDARG